MKDAIQVLEARYEIERGVAHQWLDLYIALPVEANLRNAQQSADKAAGIRRSIEILHRNMPGEDRPYFKD